jgi:hypothetical protein
MKNLFVPKRVAALDTTALSGPADGRALKVSFLYQDAPTRKCAREISERVTGLAGPESLRATWWNMSDLSEPGVLAGAVSTALRADAIVVALDAAQGLPYAFYVWAESWLPHRLQAAGALMALVGSSAPAPAQAANVREYLRAMARVGHLEFMFEERRLVPAPADSLDELTSQPVVRRNGHSHLKLLPNHVCLPAH